MAINVYWQPDPTLVGPAAYDVGLGEGLRQQQEDELRRQQFEEQQRQFNISNFLSERRFDRTFGENQRQFDTQFGEGVRQFDTRSAEGASQFDDELALKQAALDEERQNAAFNRMLAENRQRLAEYGLFQQGQNQAANRAAELEALDMRGQYGLMSDAMGYDARLAAEMMQQQGQNQRQGQQIQGQHGLLWQEQAARQMQADWLNVQKALPKLDPAEREELIGKFQERWQNANVPMPVEIPEQALPEWMDPEQKLEQFRQQYPGAPWQVDPATGEVGLPRGWNYQMDPSFQQQQHQRDLEMEQTRQKDNDAKLALDTQKFAQEGQKFEWDKQRNQMTLETQKRQADIDLKNQLNATFVDGLKQAQKGELDALNAAMPTLDQFPGTPDEEGKAKPDTAAFGKAMDEHRAKVNDVINRYKEQLQSAIQGATAPTQTQPQATPASSESANAKAQWDATPIGGTITLPTIGPVKKTGPTSYVRL